MKKLSKKQYFLIIVAVVVVISGAFYYRSNRELKRLRVQLEDLKKNPQKIAQDEVKALTDEVGKLMVLPDQEQPAIATIEDREQLKDVPFFAKAENGDRTLVYANARKAILYRPSEKRIIEVAALSMAPKIDPKTFSARIVLRNGTKNSSLIQEIAERIKVNMPKLEVVGGSGSAKENRKNTIIVDLSGDKYNDALGLASAFGGMVANLPKGEEKPQDGDFMVILGEDAANLISQVPPPTAVPASSPSASPK